MEKFSMCSPWTSINVLMLDHRRIVVEASQSTLHRALKDRGFEPLLLPFLAYGALLTAPSTAPHWTQDVAARSKTISNWFTGWQPNCHARRQVIGPVSASE